MKLIAIRALSFGFACSISVGITSAGLAQLTSSFEMPSIFAWPFLLFIAGGFPLGLLLDSVPGYEKLLWAVFPDGGSGPAFATVLIDALISWALVFALGRYYWLRKRRLGPNNSFKPNPLRSGNGVAG